MTLKVGFAQVAAPTGAPTQTIDFIDANAGFSSDVKAALIFGTCATANLTATVNSQLCVGIVGAGPTQASFSGIVTDNVTAAANVSNRRQSSTYAYMQESAGGTLQARATPSFLSNGLRLTFDAINAAYLINVVMLGGTIEAKVVNGAFPTGTPNRITLAHGLSGTPDFIFVLGDTNPADDAQQQTNTWFMGVQDIAGGTKVGVSYMSGFSSPSEIVKHFIAANCIGHSTVFGDANITVISADGTNVVLDEANTGATERVYMLAVRSTSGVAIPCKAGTFTTPTSISTPQSITGLAKKPQGVIVFPTTKTTLNTTSASQGDCSYGIGAAILNGGGIAQGSAQVCGQDSLATTNENCQTSNTKLINVLTPSSAASDVEAPVQSMDASGVTFNFTNINASAFQVAWFAFGDATAVKGGGGMDGGMQDLTGGMRG